MKSNITEEIIKSPKKRNNIVNLSKSLNSEGTNDNSAEEIKANFSDFSNLEQFDIDQSNIEFSDIITSSSEYTQSVSDAHSILNKISSKLFQSEGNHSTLLNFFEQMKIIILDSDPSMSDENTTISSACTAILDQTIKLQDENMQMKLALQRFTNSFELYFLQEMGLNDKESPHSFSKDDPISYYINLMDDLVKKFEILYNKKKLDLKKDQDNIHIEKQKNAESNVNSQANNSNINGKSSTNNKTENNNSNTNDKKSENTKEQQAQARLMKIIKDLKKKVEKMKSQKYISEAGIKKIERALSNDKIDSNVEDNDERYDKVVNEIKELQHKYKKLAKVCQALQSNFADGSSKENANDPDPVQLVKAFKDLTKANHQLKKENSKLSKLIQQSQSSKEDQHLIQELNKKINRFENDLNAYQSSFSKLEEMIIDEQNPNEKQIDQQIKLEQRFLKIADKINKLIDFNKDLTEKHASQKQMIDLLFNENKVLNDKNDQIKSILKISDIQSDDAIINQIKTLKSTNESLKDRQDKLVAQVKQIISQSKEIKNNLKTMQEEKENLSKKREELKKINLKLEEIVEQNKKNMNLLAKKNLQLKSVLDSTKKEFINHINKPEEKEEVKKVQNLTQSFNIFLLKYNKQISESFYSNYQKILTFFDSKIHQLVLQISSAKNKHEDLIKNNSIEKEKMIFEIQNLQQIANDYTDTLNFLFPSTFGLKSDSNSNDIQNYLEKMKNLTDSIFHLIPQIQHPDQNESIYSLILTLRLILASPRLSPDLTFDVSSDISENEIKLNERQIRNSVMYRNMSKIDRLSEQLYHSLCYNDVVEIISDIVHVRPKEIDEKSVVDLFNIVRQKLENAERNNEKFKDYVGMVTILLSGVASKVPSNLQTLVTQLTTFTI